MNGQNEAETLDNGEGQSEDADDASKEKGNASSSRQRSTIAFPYSDLAETVQMAEAIHTHVGHGSCDDDQLATWVDQSPKSSTFRVQLSAARMFGVTETESGSHKLTALGQQIIDPDQARAAKIQAFLSVPLYKAAYEKYKGGVVPPTAALELDFVRLGVAEKQKDRARIVFNKSAEQAGFFEHGKNKLVQPGVIHRAAPASVGETSAKDDGGNGGGGGGGGDVPPLNLDPLLMELLRKIPAVSNTWPPAKRVRWFRTFAMNVSQIYDNDENPIEFTIEISGNNGA